MGVDKAGEGGFEPLILGPMVLFDPDDVAFCNLRHPFSYNNRKHEPVNNTCSPPTRADRNGNHGYIYNRGEGKHSTIQNCMP